MSQTPIRTTTADIVDRLERLQALSLEREEEEAAARGGEEGEATAHYVEDRARTGDKRSAVSSFLVFALALQQHKNSSLTETSLKIPTDNPLADRQR